MYFIKVRNTTSAAAPLVSLRAVGDFSNIPATQTVADYARAI